MADDTNFKEWLAEKKIDFDKLSDEEKDKVKKEFASFETWLAHGKENDTGKKDWADLADANEKQDALKKFDDAFKAWAKDEQHIDDLSKKSPQEVAKLYEDYAMHVGKMRVNQNQNNPDPNTDWRQAKVDSWKHWCENEHTPAYVYDEDPNEKTALKFDVYKDTEKKEKLATIHYNNPRDVTIGTDGDKKAPDLEFFDKLTKEAKKDKIPGVTFDGETTPEFKTKLAIACLKNGLKMDGFDDKIDFSLLNDEEKKTIDFELKMKIQYHNDQKSAAQYAQEHESDKKIAIKDLMGNEKDPALAAIKYAAYEKAGIKVEGVKEFNADTRGMFIVKDKANLPQEIQDAVNVYNDKTSKENIASLKREIQQKSVALQKDPKISRQDKLFAQSLENERKDTQSARSFFAALRQKTGNAETPEAKLISGLRQDIKANKNILSDTSKDKEIEAFVSSFSDDDWKRMGISAIPAADKKVEEFKRKLNKSQKIISNRAANRERAGIVYEDEERTRSDGTKFTVKHQKFDGAVKKMLEETKQHS